MTFLSLFFFEEKSCNFYSLGFKFPAWQQRVRGWSAHDQLSELKNHKLYEELHTIEMVIEDIQHNIMKVNSKDTNLKFNYIPRYGMGVVFCQWR